MKRSVAILLTIIITFSLFGCKREGTDTATETAVPSEVVEGTGTKVETVAVPYEDTEETEPEPQAEFQVCEDETLTSDYTMPEEESVVFFPDQSYENWKWFQVPKYSWRDLCKSYAELLDYIGEEGLIVAGSAYGIREAHFGAWETTLTNFAVEQVLYGETSEKTLKISENYYPLQSKSDGRSYINFYGTWYTRLKDDQLTLLFLKPSKNIEGVYTTAYFQLPLPDDYMDYSEESLTQLLDYYRGKPGTKATTTQPKESTVTNEDGTTSTVYGFFGESQEPLENSNEEMLELMADHILVQTAVQLKIKIWPLDHVNYTGDKNFFDKDGIIAYWKRPTT